MGHGQRLIPRQHLHAQVRLRHSSNKTHSLTRVSSDTRFRRLALSTPELINRLSPLPKFNWADPEEVWNSLCRKDKLYKRNHDYMLAHPALQPRMRAILLDWLIEVCEVYRLHRETYHLAMDFVDRYLATQSDLPKQQLQLIGTYFHYTTLINY